MSKKEFEEVSIQKWTLKSGEASGKVYRVYKSEEEFEEITAESASEAMEKSGIEDIYQIKAGNADFAEVFEQGLLSRVDDEAVPQDMANEMPLEAEMPSEADTAVL